MTEQDEVKSDFPRDWAERYKRRLGASLGLIEYMDDEQQGEKDD